MATREAGILVSSREGSLGVWHRHRPSGRAVTTAAIAAATVMLVTAPHALAAVVAIAAPLAARLALEVAEHEPLLLVLLGTVLVLAGVSFRHGRPAGRS